MSAMIHAQDANLHELRDQLAGRVALLMLIAAGVLAGWLILPSRPVSPPMLVLLAALAGVGTAVLWLIKPHPRLTRHLLVWSLAAGLVTAMALFPAPWLPFVGLMLAFVGAMLVSGGGFVLAGAVVASAAWLSWRTGRAYPLLPLAALQAVGAALAWLIVRTLYTALEWAWTMQQQATRMLELSRDHQGELNRTLKSLDLTNYVLRRTQRELVFARQQAEEARRMKEQFAANVSHELRTPLNLILGFSEVMCLSSEVYGDMRWPPALRQDVYQIYRSSRHLLEMIDDVLDLSRFEMVGFVLNKEATPLGALLQEAVHICQGLFRGRSVRLDVDIAPDLPTLEVDPIRIRQVVINLLKNAARFTEEGRVRVEARREDGEVVVRVSDTGPGIPADEIPHLFQEFYQIDRSLHRQHGGAGLGLAISKRFVQAHGGRIAAISPSPLARSGQGGMGSQFVFALPMPDEPMLSAPAATWDSARRPVDDLHAPVLVVDSDPTVATLLDRHLEDYEVVQVADATGLDEAVSLHHPRAVVVNKLPPEEGAGRESFCSLAASVPWIECSLPSQSWIERDLAVAACLNKPFTRERLLEALAPLGDVRDVLVVDDDRAFCRLAQRMIETSGREFHVSQAYDGREGLRALRARKPDVLLLDLVMPEMDGFQVLEEMRRDAALSAVPVVLLTATTLAEDILLRRHSEMVVRRPEGLSLVETLRCLAAVVDVLEPRYDERAAQTAPVLETRPAA